MPRTKKQQADPVTTEKDAGTVEGLFPETVIVNTQPEARPPAEAAAAAGEKSKPDKPARKPRARRAPAKKKAAEPAAETAPAAQAPPSAPTAPAALVLDDLAREAETLRQQLGDAGRQAEETRLL